MIGHSQISPISQPVLKQGISWFAIKYCYAIKKCAISNEVLTRLCSSLLDRNFGVELDPIARNYLNYSILRYELKVIFLNDVLEARIPSIKERLNKCTYYNRCSIRTLQLQAACTLSVCDGRKIHWNIRCVCAAYPSQERMKGNKDLNVNSMKGGISSSY